MNSPNLASNEIGTNVNAIASELDIISLLWMEAIKSIEVQNLNSNIVILEFFLKASIIPIDLKKLWIYQTTNQIPYHTPKKK